MIRSQRYITIKTNHDNMSKILRLIMITSQRYITTRLIMITSQRYITTRLIMIPSQRYITTRLIMITSQRYITTKTNHDNKSKIYYH